MRCGSPIFNHFPTIHDIWAVTCDFQQCGILTSVDSDEPVQPPFKLRNSKWCSVSSLTPMEYSSDQRRLWSDCAYAQADLRLCWSHIPHCCKSYVAAQMSSAVSSAYVILKPILQTLLTLITQTDCFERSRLIRVYGVFLLWSAYIRLQ